MPTTKMDPVVVRYAELMKDALRVARGDVSQPRNDPYATWVGKAVLSENPSRSVCVEQVLAMTVDFSRRGALAAARRFYELGLEMCEVEAARVAGESSAPLSFEEAHVAEEVAEGEQDVAEAMLSPRPTDPAAQDRFIAKAENHVGRILTLIKTVRRNRVRSIGGAA